ncbi:hypothetical protein SY83_05455 [Paenibacillus swuensis]|uniref:Aminoglycoside phosphotransferase domain-containing protein n=1 Tax=Paenibacillus swuensis TaxID=1178515 RepID=A0A172TFQ5_9BACL|nr:phosphotransferase [Paenibacillus swuensis]ANE45840.1 hypothetical protein SY83_05455 [Paenibacillus swuensis]
MADKDKLISEVLAIAKQAGLDEVIPVELSSAGNLIIHLAPHPIVSRIACDVTKEGTDYVYKTLNRELKIALHLHAKGVPVLLPSELANTRPYAVGETWMTFWKYAPPTQLQPPSPSEAVELINTLSLGMKDFSDEVPLLGVWERTCQSANRLINHPDQRVQELLCVFKTVDRQLRLKPTLLIPCHGDAHSRNLLPGPEGWIWTDFEDFSLMPKYWDLASFVSNLALFNGVQEPTFTYILRQLDNGPDLEAFGIAITARILMSTLGNLDFALAGMGDLEFATKQLKLAEDFIHQVDLIIKLRVRDL